MTDRIPPDLESRIVALWDAGELPTGEIARTVGKSPTTILRVVKRNGRALDHKGIRGRLRHTDRQQDAEIVRRYAAGESAVSLAEEFGFKTHVSILQRVRAAGGDVRTPAAQRYQVPAELKAEIKRLRVEEELSQERIGEIVGMSQWRVSRILLSMGLRSWALDRHPQYAGHPVKGSGGYMLVRVAPEDPLYSMAYNNGYIKEHRYVMARALGRPLHVDETVHHINGDRADNRLENLQLRQGGHGKGVVFACADCGSHNITAVPL